MPDCRTEYLATRNKQFLCMTIFFLFLSLSVKSQTVSVADFLGDRQAAVSLTFDDGIQEHYTLVAPQLTGILSCWKLERMTPLSRPRQE